MTPLRIICMGTSEFAVPTARCLHRAGHHILCIYTQPPRPSGRGYALKKSPLHSYGEENNIEVRTPTSLKGAEVQADFKAFNADVAVVAAYGLLLPRSILEAPRLGCLNVHASLLPRWRGAAPIHRAILAGDKETGITTMQMDVGLDTGPIYLQKRTPITAAMTSATLHDLLAAMGGELMRDTLERITHENLQPVPQPEEGATYAPKLTKDEGLIDWQQPAAFIERQTRALDPWPGAWFIYNNERFKILSGRCVNKEADPFKAGLILDKGGLVQCGQGALQILRIQRAGFAAQDIEAFLRGYPLTPGIQLSKAHPCPATN